MHSSKKILAIIIYLSCISKALTSLCPLIDFVFHFWMLLPADSSYDLLNSCTIWNHCIFKHHSYPRTNIKSFRWPVCFLHILHSQAKENYEHLVLKFYTANNFIAWTQTMLAKNTLLTLHRTGQSPITVFTGHPFFSQMGTI